MTQKPNVIYSELADLTPIYCSGVAYAHLDHGNLHVGYYREERTCDGTLDRVIVLKLIIPEDAVMNGRAVINFEMNARKLMSGKDGAA